MHSHCHLLLPCCRPQYRYRYTSCGYSIAFGKKSQSSTCSSTHHRRIVPARHFVSITFILAYFHTCNIITDYFSTCVAGILRIVAIHNATIVDCFCAYIQYLNTITLLTETTDATVPYVRWALVECATVIVCGSIPAMYPLVSTWFPSRPKGARRRSESSEGSYPEGIMKRKITEISHHSDKNVQASTLRPPLMSRGPSKVDIAEWETLLRESQARANQIVMSHTPYPEV